MRAGTSRHLRQHRHHTARQVEDQVAHASHGVLDGGSKRPQEHHVARDVQPSSVQKRAGNERDQVLAVIDADGNHRPAAHECVALDQLAQENIGVRQNNQQRHQRKAARPSRYIPKRDQSCHVCIP